MKKIVYAILAISLAFLLNIWLYYYSENYSFFLKNIKYGNSVIEQESLNITDNYSPSSIKETCNCEVSEPIKCENTSTWKIIPVKNQTLDHTGQLNLLFTFFDKVTLVEKPYNEYYKIFGITDEYPTEYSIYSNKNYELYLFHFWKFDDIYNMFELLSKDVNNKNKFSLNKLNNFWNKSFFINTNVNDWSVKLVIDNWKILFWLNIKKSYYNDIKSILEKF